MQQASTQRRKSSPQAPEGLGRKVKELRTRSGMSLRELAAATNLTASSISQIERGISGGTSKSLFALATALGVSPGEFFETEADASAPTIRQALSAGGAALVSIDPSQRASLVAVEPRQESPPQTLVERSVVRAANRKTITIDGDRAPIEWQLLTVHADPRGEFIEVTYHPGASSRPGESFMQHAGWDYVLVVAGELTVSLGFEEEVVLKAGDSMSFDSTVPHRLENKARVPSRSIWFVMRGR